jgi:hypothetical protein
MEVSTQISKEDLSGTVRKLMTAPEKMMHWGCKREAKGATEVPRSLRCQEHGLSGRKAADN